MGTFKINVKICVNIKFIGMTEVSTPFTIRLGFDHSKSLSAFSRRTQCKHGFLDFLPLGDLFPKQQFSGYRPTRLLPSLYNWLISSPIFSLEDRQKKIMNDADGCFRHAMLLARAEHSIVLFQFMADFLIRFIIKIGPPIRLAKQCE